MVQRARRGLFIVPKYVPNPTRLGPQRLGQRLLEHKMGINGSATSVINYDGAQGFLLGEEHQGLAAMFTMMNYERLSVGLQGLGAEIWFINIRLSMPKSVFRVVPLSGRKAQTPKPIRCLYILMFGACCLPSVLALTAAVAFFAGMQLDEAGHNGTSVPSVLQLLTQW